MHGEALHIVHTQYLVEFCNRLLEIGGSECHHLPLLSQQCSLRAPERLTGVRRLQ